MRSGVLLLVAIFSPALCAQNVRGTAVSPAPGIPFIGTETIVWTHQVDAKTVTVRLVGTIARDGQGRVYREVHRFTVDPVNPKDTLVSTAVNDPVAGTTTSCALSTHLCRITTFPAATIAKTSPGSEQTATEGLGSQVIDGLTATGTRITQTPVPNALDLSQTADKNDDPSIVELWRSVDLKVDLSELRKYPHGEVQVRLAITSREEPGPKIFSIPTGFSIRDDRAVRRIGHGVSAPVLIYSVTPQYSPLAKTDKISGNVLVNLVVDQNGIPTNVRIVRGIGYGLDEEAVEAVRKYRFKPAMENGQPVPVELNLMVNFQIF